MELVNSSLVLLPYEYQRFGNTPCYGQSQGWGEWGGVGVSWTGRDDLGVSGDEFDGQG